MNRTCNLLFILSILFLGNALGWGNDGHQIVGQVASAFVTPTTQTALNRMLNGLTLANISTWPDNYDHDTQGEWSGHLHYANLPNNATSFNYAYCLPPIQVPIGCVVTAVSNFTELLRINLANNYWQNCTEVDDSEEPCDLSFLVHFIGDLHQPLHVAFGSDLGGNSFNVNFFGTCTQLHSVWDSSLIFAYEDDNDLTWQGVAEQITSFIKANPSLLHQFLRTTKISHWADESFTLARDIPYNFSPGSVPENIEWLESIIHHNSSKHSDHSVRSDCGGEPYIGENYYTRCIPVVLEQLAKAGYRLAYQLNSIYDPTFRTKYWDDSNLD